MKIYNFAMEVYDSPGSGIGRCRSCGQQEWELISHEVILQLLFFPPLIHLTLVTQPFLGSFVYAIRVCPRVVLCCEEAGSQCTCVIFFPPKVDDGSLCAMCVRHVNVTVAICSWKWRGSAHCTPGWWWDLLSWNHLSKVGNFLKGVEKGPDERKREELERSAHPHWKWWIINKGKGTMFLIYQRLTLSTSAPLQLCCCWAVTVGLMFMLLEMGKISPRENGNYPVQNIFCLLSFSCVVRPIHNQLLLCLRLTRERLRRLHKPQHFSWKSPQTDTFSSVWGL